MDTSARTLTLRLRAQGLTGARARGVEAVCERLVGIQAQDLGFARLSFRPRCTRAVAGADVDAALDAGVLVWTWSMRGTLHLVRAADAGWLVGLLGPIFAARGRPRRLALGLDDALCERALEVLRDALAAEGPMTRAALAARAGIDPTGQAPAHLLAFAALRGIVRRVPAASGREPTFAPIGQPPQTLGEDEALALLARRYLAGHAPAGSEDLAAWSGIGLRRARRALQLIAGELREQPGGGFAPSDAPARVRAAPSPHVRLLGHFDPYLLGHASRDLVLAPRYAPRVQTGGGFIAPALLVDGRVAGTWSRARERDWLAPFEPLPESVLAAAERERADVERFLAASG